MTHQRNQHSQVLDFPRPRTRKDAALDALPSETITRWTATAKKAVLEAIRIEVLTVTDACKRYDLTADEVESWDKREQMYGRNGLMATQISRYRRAASHQATGPLQPRQTGADTI